MMADAVEAASRSLKEYTEENISKLVNTIIDSQIADGLLNNSPISFRDIRDVKEAFIENSKPCTIPVSVIPNYKRNNSPYLSRNFRTEIFTL